MDASLPVLPADLTFVKVNGGRAYGHLLHWESRTAPTVGQRVLAADAGSERLVAVIADVRPDGVIALTIPEFADVPPTADVDAAIAERLNTLDLAAELAAENITTVALDEAGRMIEYRPDGTTTVLS